jgi:hypothetical protein
VFVLLGDGRSCYVVGEFFWGSVLGHNNGVAFLWGPFRGPVGGQMWRLAESMAGETSSRPTIAGFEIL